jgi:flavorubredoxin
MGPKTTTDEVAPDIFRISTFIPEVNLQFSQFLVRDERPLLYHTGMRALFPQVREAVARLIDPASLRYVGFSHFEADECGALNEWLKLAPQAEAVCGFVAANVNVGDLASRPPRALNDGDILETGRHRFRYLSTPQVPHGWDAGLLFDEHASALFCSDLLHQNGDVEARTVADLVGRFRQTLRDYEQGPLAGYIPWTPRTAAILQRLTALEPRVLLPMHGSCFEGNGAATLSDMARMLQDELGA